MILMTVDYIKKSQKCNFQKVKIITYKYRMNGRKTFLQFIKEVVSRMVKLVQSSRRMGGTSIREKVEVACWDRYKVVSAPIGSRDLNS